MEDHRSKTANIKGFYLAHNTLPELNELTHSWPITYCHQFNINEYLCRASESKTMCFDFRYEIWEKFNEHHGSVKLYTAAKAKKTLDCLGWFRAGRRSRAVTNMYKNIYYGHEVL
jgi:hypothetical protein